MELLTVPAIIAIVEVMKTAGFNGNYAPAAALGLGIAMSLLFVEVSVDSLGTGLLLGLAASGLYSATKHTAERIIEDTRF